MAETEKSTSQDETGQRAKQQVRGKPEFEQRPHPRTCIHSMHDFTYALNYGVSCIQPENYTQKREFLQAHISALHMNRTFPGFVAIVITIFITDSGLCG
ncbi:hypothetical protein A7D00_1776 [Trichophyton violaceum]|uniref:Uncharacterized protein n=1 Tax=Trichophyton violaceum TaxID=34388 RepID=A0A178FNT0_TRIVO|nr:hypothetical protein A7D00_1776 [Trichophyton violaceum]